MSARPKDQSTPRGNAPLTVLVIAGLVTLLGDQVGGTLITAAAVLLLVHEVRRP